MTSYIYIYNSNKAENLMKFPAVDSRFRMWRFPDVSGNNSATILMVYW